MILVILDLQFSYESKYCHCIADDYIGPWCSKWFNREIPYCTISGGDKARFCPGAVKYNDVALYYTTHAAVCNKTRGNL